MNPYQATCVAIAGRGLLIEGPAGSGKSSLALALLDRGALLVGDDSLLLEPRHGQLFAHPHPRTRGMIEVRNLGLLPCGVAPLAPVALVICLDEGAPRYVEAAETWQQFGCAVPMLRLWPHSPILWLRAERALAHYGA
jgi:hypothetical protein